MWGGLKGLLMMEMVVFIIRITVLEEDLLAIKMWVAVDGEIGMAVTFLGYEAFTKFDY